METVLVTGGAGFIGSNFVRYLLQNEPAIQVVNLDALTYAGSPENLKNLPDSGRQIFIQGDICNQSMVEDLLRQYEIKTLVHFAAESHVDRSILGPKQFVQTNIVGTLSLLEAVRQVWQKEQLVSVDQLRFHHVSTDEVYGSLNPDDAAFTEATPYAPNSPYSASKAASDHLVRAYAHTYSMPISITNCSNNYGPYQFPEKLIPLILFNALSGKVLPVYGDGQQIRDWLYVEDHCAAISTVIKQGEVGSTYNVGGDNQITNLALVQELCAILDEHFPESSFTPHARLIKFVADRPGHDRRYAMNIHKISQELGWQPQESFSSGLRKTVSWYLSNPTWITEIAKQNGYQQWLESNYRERV